jgi:uridylate kinase
LTHHEVLENRLEVMDSTAAALCKDNDIEIIVFDMNIEGNIKRAALGEKIGSVIS